MPELRPNTPVNVSQPSVGQSDSPQKAVSGLTKLGQKVKALPLSKTLVKLLPGQVKQQSLQERTVKTVEPETRLSPQKEARGVLPQYMEGKVQAPPKPAQVQQGKILGKGAFGEVSTVVNKADVGEMGETPGKLQKPYVVKKQKLGKDRAIAEQRNRQAWKEVAIQQKLKGAVPVVGQKNNKAMTQHKVMMEHAGNTLNSMLHRPGEKGAEPVPESLRKDLAFQLINQLSEMHSQGVIHRDIKPENILVNNQGKAAIVDYGISLEFTEDAPYFSEVWATTSCMTPEMTRNELYSKKADIWTMGRVLAEMASGYPPPPVTEVFNDRGEVVGYHFDEQMHYQYLDALCGDPRIGQQEKDLIVAMLQPFEQYRASTEDLLSFPFISKMQGLSGLSYSELQTSHQQAFQQLAAFEDQLASKREQLSKSGNDKALQVQINELEQQVTETGEEVKELQEEMKLRDMQSQIHSLEQQEATIKTNIRRLNAVKRLTGLTGADRKELKAESKKLVSLQVTLKGARQDLEQLQPVLPSAPPPPSEPSAPFGESSA